MKLQAISISLGMLAFSFLAAAPAYAARSTTAFSAFHLENTHTLKDDPYKCILENNGAVVNACPYAVNLEFDLPIDNPGTHSVAVQDYWTGIDTFNCVSYAYTGQMPSSTIGSQITFTKPLQDLVTTVNATAGMSIQLICWNVPAGGGVANLNWNP